MTQEPHPAPSGGCVITLLVFGAILFLSLTLASPKREANMEGPPFVDTSETTNDTAKLR